MKRGNSLVWALTGGIVATMLTGTAVAANGGGLLIGRSNYGTATTTLSNSHSGAALSLKTASKYTPPLAVSNTTRIPSLDADLLDGLHASSLQRRVAGTCAAGTAVQSVASNGGVSCGTAMTYTLVTAQMSNGAAVAECPAGLVAVGGGVVPDFGDSTNGFSDPLIWADGPGYDSQTSQFTWVGGAEDKGGGTVAYNGGGVVAVYCVPNAAVVPGPTPTPTASSSSTSTTVRSPLQLRASSFLSEARARYRHSISK